MPGLTAPRFVGDPILQACRDGQHRMLVPEAGPAVQKVQEALIDLGFPLPLRGADSKFGSETGDAVTAFKTSRRIFPNDPVVGPGTMTALDAECFDKPPPPFSDRDEWLSWVSRDAVPTLSAFNFTRADELARRKSGRGFTFDAASNWLPDRFRDAISQSLAALLEPTGSPAGPGSPSATWGAGVFDLYHCHVMVVRGASLSPSIDLMTGLSAMQARIRQLRAQSATAPGAAIFNRAWATAHRANMLSSGVLNQARDLANTVIAEATAAKPAVLVWHSFEEPRWRPATMVSSTPRRHWQTQLAPAAAAIVTPLPFVTSAQLGDAFNEIFEIYFVVSKTAVITAAPGSREDAYAMAGLVPDDVAAFM
jgi:hypothetical protein